jgi:hypothetical protein
MPGQSSDINPEGAQGAQAIPDAVAGFGTGITGLTRSGLSRSDNSLRWYQNTLGLLFNPPAQLLPLIHVSTGLDIPDCPTTVAEIHQLSEVEATRILQALQVPVPVGLTAQRTAVLEQFTNPWTGVRRIADKGLGSCNPPNSDLATI